jgi:hypothetical protein
MGRPEVPAVAERHPGDAGELVRKHNRKLVVVQPLGRGLDSGFETVTLPTHALHIARSSRDTGNTAGPSY